MKKQFFESLQSFWDWVDNRGVIRRIVLGVTMWMTFWVSFRMTEFAFSALDKAQINGNTALIITAITTPIVALGGYVFKIYLDSRST
jgi:heme/copper-type cytochrome/quinol oxidase subunit 2